MKKILLNIIFVFITIYSSDLYSYNNEFPPADDNGIYLLLIKGDSLVTRAAKLFGYPNVLAYRSII